MDVTTDVAGLNSALRDARNEGLSIGFVPTMGYLHDGHLALVVASRAQDDVTVLSIYVNPSQFAPNEDLDRYPRDMERDLSLAEAAGVDVVFAPLDALMYPNGLGGQVVWVDANGLGDRLEGAFRPGHFRGVSTVVTKLLHMVLPSALYLGQKDAQQAVVLRRMVSDLAFPVDVRVIPTVRDADGLALSSRNVYLTGEERQQASTLFQALSAARERFERGERSSERLMGLVQERLAENAPSGRVDYVALVDRHTLDPITGQVKGNALLCVAVWFGNTRLIDNMLLG